MRALRIASSRIVGGADPLASGMGSEPRAAGLTASNDDPARPVMSAMRLRHVGDCLSRAFGPVAEPADVAMLRLCLRLARHAAPGARRDAASPIDLPPPVMPPAMPVPTPMAGWP